MSDNLPWLEKNSLFQLLDDDCLVLFLFKSLSVCHTALEADKFRVRPEDWTRSVNRICLVIILPIQKNETKRTQGHIITSYDVVMRNDIKL